MTVIHRYRKREPIEIDAAQVTVENIAAIAEWCEGRVVYAGNLGEIDNQDAILVQSVGIKLRTDRRLQVALIGDYIYKDHEGVFHKMDLQEFLFEFEPHQGDETVAAESKENTE